ncbi:MAG: hypothetical protein ACI9OJ_002381 [Myxococcota bacterium]|jgi:hypothetical protein
MTRRGPALRTLLALLVVSLGCSSESSSAGAVVDVVGSTSDDDAEVIDLDAAEPADALLPDSQTDTVVAVKRSIIDNRAWTVVDKALDPFYEAAGGKADMCPPEALKIEEEPDGPWFDVRTKTCGYVTVTEPSQTAVNIGSELFVRVWHFKATEGDGPFHLALALGDEADVVWEETIGIPSDSNLLFTGFTAEKSYPKGTPVYFHVSNHGDNSWNLIEFSTTD